jgi:aminomethyltransferase
MNAGKQFDIAPIGLGARDTLRLEMGFCLYGHDIDQTTNPIEAGLGWITKVDKGDFIGRPTILKTKQEGAKRKLVGFVMEDKAFPRQGYPLLASDASTGIVTSGTMSPTLEKGIGMGYVGSAHAKPGTPLTVEIRSRRIPASVVPVPFIKK